MATRPDRKIILENGQEYCGRAFGAAEERILEIVFNTSMTGYQEILSDPSYTDQAVVMTYPLIGNYGMAPEDYETARPSIGALIVREYNNEPSHCRSEETLGSVMARLGIPGICDIDTRRLNDYEWAWNHLDLINRIKAMLDRNGGFVNGCVETLSDRNQFVAKQVRDIADRLKEVYGETLPRELNDQLDYIVSQTYQATFKYLVK